MFCKCFLRNLSYQQKLAEWLFISKPPSRVFVWMGEGGGGGGYTGITLFHHFAFLSVIRRIGRAIRTKLCPFLAHLFGRKVVLL